MGLSGECGLNAPNVVLLVRSQKTAGQGGGNGFFRPDQGGVVRGCFLHKDGFCFWVAFSNHNGNARLDDAGLFSGNGRTGVPQILLVVQANARDHAHFRMDHVGTVQPTAQPHFHHRNVHPVPAEGVESHPYGGFKKTAPNEYLLVVGHKVHHLLLGNQGAVYANALAKIHQMRRGVEANFVASGLENRRQQVAGGALAVGSGYVDGAKTSLRTFQGVQQHLRLDQVYLVVGTPTGALEYRKAAVQPLRGLREGHQFFSNR